MTNERKKLYAVTGIGVFAIPLIFSLINTFKAYANFFGDSLQGVERSKLEGIIVESLSGIIVWPLFGFLGIILIAVLLDGIEYKEKWVFWTLILMGLHWLICFPAGSFIGLSLLIYLIINMKKFGVRL